MDEKDMQCTCPQWIVRRLYKQIEDLEKEVKRLKGELAAKERK